MNDMTRPGSAARLSEDIGDVLGAIRRLIAEDEALDHGGDTLKIQKNDGSQAAATEAGMRHAGHAAMARRMVAQGNAAMGRDYGDASVAPFQDDRPQTAPVFRSPMIADRSAPVMRGGAAVLSACRDLPQRAEALATETVASIEPLRLLDSDRVINEKCETVAPCGSAVPARAFADQNIQPQSEPLSQPQALHFAQIDDDDFAEAFDAKARMRPEIVNIAAVAQPDNAADELDEARFEETHDLPADIEAAPAPHTAIWEHVAEDADQSAMIDAPVGVDEPLEAEDVATAPVKGLSIPAYVTNDDAEAQQEQPVAATAEAAPVSPTIDEPDPATHDEEVDEATVRELIREMIQEELHGELGQRFSRNLRAVIRREVAASIDEHLERL